MSISTIQQAIANASQFIRDNQDSLSAEAQAQAKDQLAELQLAATVAVDLSKALSISSELIDSVVVEKEPAKEEIIPLKLASNA